MEALSSLVPYYHETWKSPYRPQFEPHLQTVADMSLEEYKEVISQTTRPSEIRPETVASYLFGCEQDYYGAVPQSCSLLCLTSKLKDAHQCASQVWSTHKGYLERIQDAHATHAYLYRDTYLLQPEDVRTLEDHGVQRVTLLNTYKGIHQVEEKDALSMFLEPPENKESLYVEGDFNDFPWWSYGVVLALLLLFLWKLVHR